MSEPRSIARLAYLLAISFGVPLLGDEPHAGSRDSKNQAAAPKETFVRVRRDENGVAIALETAVVRFVSSHDKDQYVDLVGAVHIADRSYYERLNQQFRAYDAVLYELVAPEGTRIPRGGPDKESSHPVSQLQGGMKELLELEHQLSVIDYTAGNLVHADMSPEEFAKSMKDRGESFLQILLKMTLEGMAQEQQTHQVERGGLADLALSLVSRKKAAQVQENFARQWRNVVSGKGLELNDKNAGQLGDLEMLLAMFSSNRAARLKRVMAEQMAALGGTMSSLDGPEGSTIVTERNKKALAVLRREIAAGKLRVAVFYGAAHLPDMENRLLTEFNLTRGETRWLTAWDLQDPEE